MELENIEPNGTKISVVNCRYSIFFGILNTDAGIGVSFSKHGDIGSVFRVFRLNYSTILNSTQLNSSLFVSWTYTVKASMLVGRCAANPTRTSRTFDICFNKEQFRTLEFRNGHAQTPSVTCKDAIGKISDWSSYLTSHGIAWYSLSIC